MAASAGGSLSPHAWTIMQFEEECAKRGLPRGDCMIKCVLLEALGPRGGMLAARLTL